MNSLNSRQSAGSIKRQSAAAKRGKRSKAREEDGEGVGGIGGLAVAHSSELTHVLESADAGSRAAAIGQLQAGVGNANVARLVDSVRHTVVARKPAVATGRSRADAEKLVPAHVDPKPCFVWYVNNKEGWAPLPGTGCAHWVAHQLGITEGAKCDAGFSIRVPSVIQGRTSVELADVQVGDIWKNLTGRDHVGIVRAVNVDPKTHKVVSVDVENDSSRQGGVVTNTFKSGEFYR